MKCEVLVGDPASGGSDGGQNAASVARTRGVEENRGNGEQFGGAQMVD